VKSFPALLLFLVPLACSSRETAVADLPDGGDAGIEAGRESNDAGTDAASATGAKVTVSRDGKEQSFEWPYVECRPDGKKYFMRMAESDDKGGEDGLHLDVDVCGFEGAGTYPALDPFATSCAAGKRYFDVFWHPKGAVFVNRAASTPCTLVVEGDKELTIRVHCEGMGTPGESPNKVSVRAEARCARR
jgi:hypothetical protein